jgi:peptide/nickel transport system ATP-binding protein
VFYTTMNNMNWSIGLEVTLSVLGFTNIDTPTIGVMIYWANQHTAMVAGIWWWIFFPVLFVVILFIGLFLLAISMNEYIDPRSRLARMGGMPDEALPDRAPERRSVCSRSGICVPITGRNISGSAVRYAPSMASVLHVDRNEIYGLAGESSCGKTTLIKTIVRAIRPPLDVVGGSVTFHFAGRDRDIHALSRSELEGIRWRHLSYILQGSMNVLNPVRRVRQSFVDFAHRHIGKPMPEFLHQVESHLARVRLEPAALDAYPHELSGGMRQRVTIALATVCRPDFIVADEPTTALDVVVQKDVLGMLREVQQEIRSSMILVTHDIGVHANVTDRLGSHVRGPPGGRGPHRRCDPRSSPPLHVASRHEPAADRRRDAEARARRRATQSRRPADRLPLPSALPLAMATCHVKPPPMVDVAPGHRVACWVTGASRKNR